MLQEGKVVSAISHEKRGYYAPPTENNILVEALRLLSIQRINKPYLSIYERLGEAAVSV